MSSKIGSGFGSLVDRAELNHCGWVIQERVLSWRTIHFGVTHLFWECRQTQSFSTIQNGQAYEIAIPQNVLAWRNRKNWRDSTEEAKSKFSLGLTDLDELYELWNRIRQDYTNTSVTYREDKLIALSGLATIFQVLLEDQYLAGLWRRTLINDLLWSVPGPRN